MISFIARLFERYLPSAFSLAVLLTLLVSLAVLVFTGIPAAELAGIWQEGLWNLLGFAMQMCLILISGYALARSHSMHRILERMIEILDTPIKAVIGVSIIAAVASWINWGMGLVVGAILARSLGGRVQGLDYRVLVAAAYSGFVFWHGGLSGSIPLTLAGGGSSLISTTGGILTEAIPIEQTLLSLQNLIMLGLLIVLVPLVNGWMHPSEDKVHEVEGIEPMQAPKQWEISASDSALRKAEGSAITIRLIGLAILMVIVIGWAQKGFQLGLNTVILLFLSISMLLHQSIPTFLDSLEEGLKGCTGIVLQFPFYAGIMAMMAATDSEGNSLAGLLIEWFVAHSNAESLPFLSFLSAGILNVLIPSGGGQWALQAPIMLSAAQQMGADMATVSMAIAWGDAWTNMIQPFWALPLLAIAKLDARDIMGYCIAILILVLLVAFGVFWVL